MAVTGIEERFDCETLNSSIDKETNKQFPKQ